jgi:hypothetical protein
LYEAVIAFIGMSGVPPFTGPETFGTATAVLAARGCTVVVDAPGDACLLEDEHAVAATAIATRETMRAVRRMRYYATASSAARATRARPVRALAAGMA